MSEKVVKKRSKGRVQTTTKGRKLAAIMFTDMVGFTALNQFNESQALEVLERHNRLLRPFFAKFKGREVKTMGDSFLVEFDSALDSTNCAIEIQKFLHDYNVSTSDDWKIKLRIGIHVGDVVRKGKDIFGDAVNVASRIEPLADPEGICISQQVFDQVHNKIGFQMSQLEHPELRNVKFETRVYSIAMPWLLRGPDRKEHSRQESVRPRVAVLPFSNMSPDPNDEYFADGITDEVISTISKIQGIEVISRTSIMQYKKAPKAIKEVSKELDVGTVLEGSVRKAGNKLRVTAQMIDADRDRHLWAESYDRDLKDVFEIQSDIATKVAEALLARFSRNEKDTEGAENIEAYTAYLRAMQKYHESTESSLKEAISLFERAISQDRNLARAYAGLAHAWGKMANLGYEDFTVAARRAEIAAKKALQLAPDSGEAHAALAAAYAYVDKFEESIIEARKAIETNISLSEAHIWLGVNICAVGNAEDGLRELQKGYELDPLSVHSATYLGYVYMALGRNSEALDMLERLNRSNPSNADVYAMLADCYMEMNEYSKAEEMLHECLLLSPEEPRGKLGQALLYAYTGKKKEAEMVLREIMESETEALRLWGEFFVQNALGNLDESFRALMRMAEVHAWPFQIKSMPELKELRKDPRFLDFLKKVGLPP